jgi:hypothetical protein
MQRHARQSSYAQSHCNIDWPSARRKEEPFAVPGLLPAASTSALFCSRMRKCRGLQGYSASPSLWPPTPCPEAPGEPALCKLRISSQEKRSHPKDLRRDTPRRGCLRAKETVETSGRHLGLGNPALCSMLSFLRPSEAGARHILRTPSRMPGPRAAISRPLSSTMTRTGAHLGVHGSGNRLLRTLIVRAVVQPAKNIFRRAATSHQPAARDAMDRSDQPRITSGPVLSQPSKGWATSKAGCVLVAQDPWSSDRSDM